MRLLSATPNLCIVQKEGVSAATRDWTRDLQIFSLTLSQLSYSGLVYNTTPIFEKPIRKLSLALVKQIGVSMRVCIMHAGSLISCCALWLCWKGEVDSIKGSSPVRGIEPRPPGWKPEILTTRPHGTCKYTKKCTRAGAILTFVALKRLNSICKSNKVFHPFLKLSKVPPRLELGSQDSESWVLTITPWNQHSALSVSMLSFIWGCYQQLRTFALYKKKESVPPPGIEPGTFRSSVWRSPNWAIAA